MGARRLSHADTPRNRTLNGIGVVAALAAEARAFGSPRSGTLLALSGIGAAAAGIAARGLVEARVSSLMTFGLAGGLDPALTAGSVVLPDRLISVGGLKFEVSGDWRSRVAAAIGSSRTVTGGLLLSSTDALATTAQKAAAFRSSGAAAVDMESIAVAEVAAANSIPFIAVRVVVDTAADVLPPTVIAASRAGRVQIGRLISGLVLAPGEITALIRLAQRYRTAMRSLRAVAGQVA
jgi:adenosylhomocysteine nucleosidase